MICPDCSQLRHEGPCKPGREHDFDSPLGACTACGLYVEDCMGARYCTPQRLRIIKHVQQETPGGCVIASLAMLAGMTFKEVLAEYPWSDGGCDMETVSEDFCYRHGFARARIYRWHPGPTIRDGQDWKVEQDKRRRDPWPPKPFAPAHLCMVQTSQYHCVVMLRDGTVLDPLTPEPKRLSDYTETTQVHGIWDIR